MAKFILRRGVATLLVVLAVFPFTAPFAVCDLSDLTHAMPVHAVDGYVADGAKNTEEPSYLGPIWRIATSLSFEILVAFSLPRAVTPIPGSTNRVLRV